MNGRFLFKAAILGLGLALAACSSSQKSPQTAARTGDPKPSPKVSNDAPSAYKVGKPYKIGRSTYKPKERFAFREVGQASWYGPGFHGRQTANGERFDQRAMTAAHPTLQMPSIVKVTNLGNGRTVVLRVNDRGPYHGGRVLDVSEAAAEELGFKRLGTAKVRIDLLEAPSREAARLAKSGASVAKLENVRLLAATAPSEPAPEPEKEIRLASVGAAVGTAEPVSRADQAFIQAGAFSQIANARKLQASVADLGQVEVLPMYANGKRLYRVRLGPYPDLATAERALEDVAARGLADAHLVLIQ